MTFDKIIEDGRLWAVRFDNDKDNALEKVMSQWSDASWLADFFTQNVDDLLAYFRITNIEDAIYQTMEDRDELACIIMDISPDANLDHFFRPLENNRASEMLLSKEKGCPHHRSWLRLYAIKLNVGVYIITGGAIKLTRTMQEREHTLQELEKMEKVRNFLIRERVFDEDSITDYQREIEPWTQEEAIARLSQYQTNAPSKWREQEEKRRRAKEEGWLLYSRRIAIKIAMAMKQQNLSRQDVAERMVCSPQYISRLLKGEENLSLETICKLETALNVSILQYEFV